ncbi:carbohydrate sulfotransferase 15-like isoform X2 [Sebastes umbrosus]|uniref:carbohydrate sulfotransferase 15-like isoform X2 n=1 Tax=Sebastes umbrosus TaxID=72105 RepID=UPI00189D035A|nr:carbohydrate sulfotransferase 15-like isoform X2 [Sebastes umbrosus]
MSLSDCKHGSDTQTEHARSLHSLPMAENYGKRLVRTLFDFRHTNVTENLAVKWTLTLANMWSFSKVKVVSFLMAFTLVFLIMVSYNLMSDRIGLLLTPAPYQPRPAFVPTSTAAAAAAAAAAEVPSEKNLLDMKLLVKIIGSKLEYKPRKVPDEKDVIGTDSNLFSIIPRHFMPGIKSPCWYEEFSNKLGTDPYRKNLFGSSLYDRLKTDFHRHLLHSDGKLFRLRCLPFFYIIGQPKCGTTDLYHRLRLHPDVRSTTKEPHWWTRKRFGYIRFKDGFQKKYPVEDYLDLFDWAAQNIQEGISGNSSGDHRRALITVDASASTMWDNQAWSYLHSDREETEPPFLVQDFIHTIQPDAKIVIMLRDPVERLYSDYLYFKMANKSAEDFHQKVVESLQLFQSCLSERSLRSCVYGTSLSNAMPVRLTLGIYFVYLLDWLTVFQREQILVFQLKDYSANLKVSIKKVFDFLTVLCRSNWRKQ